MRVVSEFVTQQTTKRKWAVAAGLFSHTWHTHTHTHTYIQVHTCTHTHTHTHHRHTQVNISHLPTSTYIHTELTSPHHTHTHTLLKSQEPITARHKPHHRPSPRRQLPWKQAKTLTRSSTTSSILARAPSMHCWAPFRTTLSKVVPERGKLIRTPPFSADMSCTSCECGECGEGGEGVCWACG